MEDNKINETITKLRIQIEYYLSDENLKADKFFHDKILSDSDVSIFKIGLFRHRSIIKL